MTENPRSILNESISALVDGQSNDLDLQRILNSMDEEGASPESGQSIRQTWSRYHAMSAVMKNESAVDLSVDLSVAIRDAIAEEAPHKVKRFSFNTISQGIGKTAVAAAVTFGVVFGVQQFTSSPAQLEPALADTSTSAQPIAVGAVVPQGFELPPLTARTVSTNSLAPESIRARAVMAPLPQNRIVISTDQFQEQMNRLMQQHAEQVSTSGGMGVIPFARVSNFMSEEKD